jgi:hypothetical protein
MDCEGFEAEGWNCVCVRLGSDEVEEVVGGEV